MTRVILANQLALHPNTHHIDEYVAYALIFIPFPNLGL